jgi:hypothetical protein
MLNIDPSRFRLIYPDNYRSGYHIVSDRFGFRFILLTDHIRSDNLYTDT